MKRSRLAASAASLLLSSVICFPALAAPVCWQSYEVDAAMVRNLQTLMMVGTLKCGNAGSAMEAGYNSFVARNRNMIVNSNNVLKAHFMREEGITSGQQAYDRFVTGLANTHSSPAHLEGFCQVSETLMTLAGAANEPDVMTLARTFANQPAGLGESCKVEQVAVAAVVPATVAAPAAATGAAATGVQPAPAPQSAAAALQAAAVAMQEAAKALEAQQGAAPAMTPVAAASSSDVTAPADLNTQVVDPAPVVPPQPLS